MSTFKHRKLSWLGHVCRHNTQSKITLKGAVQWIVVAEEDRVNHGRTTARSGQASHCRRFYASQRTYRESIGNHHSRVRHSRNDLVVQKGILDTIAWNAFSFLCHCNRFNQSIKTRDAQVSLGVPRQMPPLRWPPIGVCFLQRGAIMTSTGPSNPVLRRFTQSHFGWAMRTATQLNL